MYNGRSLLELLKWFPFAPHCAFDSFVILPNEASDEKWVQKNFHAAWAYATRNARALRTRLGRGASNVKIVPGFYNVSLSSQLAASLQIMCMARLRVQSTPALARATAPGAGWDVSSRVLCPPPCAPPSSPESVPENPTT